MIIFEYSIRYLMISFAVYVCVFGGLRAQETPDTLLLKDYRPESIYVIPVTTVEKARYPIIDMHSHAYAEGAEEIAQWVKNMDAVGVEKTIILTGLAGAKFDSVYALYSKCMSSEPFG